MTVRDAVGRLRRWAGVSGVLFTAIMVLLQFGPLTSVLGYEFAVATAATLTLVGVGRGIRRLSDAGPMTPWAAWCSVSADLGRLLGIALSIGVIQALLGTSCDPFEGIVYFFIFAVGTVPLLAATVVLVHGGVGPRWRLLVGYGVVALSVLRALLWLALQPAIQVYEPFVGWFAGSIYDEALVDLLTHGWFRVGCVGLAVALMGTRQWVATRQPVAFRLALVGLVVLFSVYAQRQELGIERSRSWIIRELGGHVRTAHFDIFFDAASTSDAALREMVYDHEARYRELRSFWGIEPRQRLRSFVYASRDQKGEMMGGRNTLVAKIWLGEMHIVWDGIGDSMLVHEMAHLFLKDAGSGPLRLASRWNVIPMMALVEGAAGAAEWHSSDLDEHAWSAAMHRLNLAETMDELLGPAGFWSAPSGRAYTLTSSFCRWLIEAHGPERFLQAYATGNFSDVYGRSLSELSTEWSSWLVSYPLDESMLALASYRFDRPSIFGKRCARQVATRFEEAQGHIRARRPAEARRCLEDVLAMDPQSATWSLTIAGRLHELGDVERAVELATRVSVEAGFGVVRQRQASEFLADLWWQDGQTDRAGRAYEVMLGEAMAAADRRRLSIKLWAIRTRDERPAMSSLIQRVLLELDEGTSNHAAEMVEQWHVTNEPLAAYLSGLWLAPSNSVLSRQLLERAWMSDLSVEVRLQSGRTLALGAWRASEYEQSCATWTRLQPLVTPGSELAAELALWNARCEDDLRLPADLTGLDTYGAQGVLDPPGSVE